MTIGFSKLGCSGFAMHPRYDALHVRVLGFCNASALRCAHIVIRCTHVGLHSDNIWKSGKSGESEKSGKSGNLENLENLESGNLRNLENLEI